MASLFPYNSRTKCLNSLSLPKTCISQKKTLPLQPEVAKRLMKQIINIQEQYGAELHTRQMMERLASNLQPADELYNLTHSDMHVDLINIEPFVEKMLSAVIKGRFLPRQHNAGDMPIIHCTTIGSVQRQLMAN